jgi:uncharacterized RDD family membrane protein YckC
MIIYFIIGLVWIALLDFVIKIRIEEEPMNNASRLLNFVLWPLTLLIFLYGLFQSMFGNNNEE